MKKILPFLFLLSVGCDGNNAENTKQLSALTAGEAASLCQEIASSVSAIGKTDCYEKETVVGCQSCLAALPQEHTDLLAECNGIDMSELQGCDATVSTFTQCLDAVADIARQTTAGVACGEELKTPGQIDLTACQTLQHICPDFSPDRDDEEIISGGSSGLRRLSFRWMAKK
jgi:hypothetical protein